MEMTTLTFNLHELKLPTATRPNGQELFNHISSALANPSSNVIIDFEDSTPTPSFVDQSIGTLVKTLGLERFKSRVKLINVSDEIKPLIRYVVLTRAAQTSETVSN
jgi:hypothetical protein